MSQLSRLGLFAALLGLVAAGPVSAQSGPPIPTMPPPPSAGDPAPKEGAKAKPQTGSSRRAKAKTVEDGSPDLAGSPRARAGGATSSRADRFSREEIDDPNGTGGSGGSRVAPFLSETGRAGLGGRF